MTNPLRIVPTCVSSRWLRLLAEKLAGAPKVLPAVLLTSAALLTSSAVHADGSSASRIFQPVPMTNVPASDGSAQPVEVDSDADNLPVAISEPWPAAQLAIVIDDLGYDKRRGLEAIALPGRLTVAVMPHTPNGRFLAEAAHAAGREIILHHPMQGSDYRRKSSSPKGILTLDMGPDDIRFALRQALTSVPHCIGINNHTGSTLTQARNHMYWLMQQVASTDLYYLDSRTTTQTVAGEAAQAWGVPFVSRDVFLDHHNDRASIAKQFQYAVKLAKRRGHAVLLSLIHI